MGGSIAYTNNNLSVAHVSYLTDAKQNPPSIKEPILFPSSQKSYIFRNILLTIL